MAKVVYLTTVESRKYADEDKLKIGKAQALIEMDDDKWTEENSIFSDGT